jgi:cell division protein ZipA
MRMTTTLIIIIGLSLVGLIAYLFYRPKAYSFLDDYFVSTQGQSNARIESLNLDKASEDASYILDTNALSFPTHEGMSMPTVYVADPRRKWIVNVDRTDGGTFKKEDIARLFDLEWRHSFPSTIYGFSLPENRWTYANAGDAVAPYSKLQVAIDVQDAYSEEFPNFDPQTLIRYVAELKRRAANNPHKLKIEETETVDEAIVKAKQLVQLYQEFNRSAIIVLQSNDQYSGLAVWDALQSVGLQWGDGDLFHWHNNRRIGGDQHFSVWTTTEPGYFLPEEVVAGNMNPKNIVFGYSIPRSLDPKGVYDVMVSAVKYCQKRLGGQILDNSGQQLDIAKEQQRIVELADKMKSKGIVPGSHNALRMF